MSALPDAYLKLVLPLIDKARGFLENGESLQPFAFVGSAASGEMLPVMIDTQTAESKDNSALLIKTAAEQTQADFIFTIMEAWGLPRDKMPRYQEILDKYGQSAQVLTKSTPPHSSSRPAMVFGGLKFRSSPRAIRRRSVPSGQ